MFEPIKIIWTKFSNLVTAKNTGKSDDAKNKYSDEKVLLIGKNKSNLEDIESIITQLNRNCIYVKTIEEATKYLDTNFPNKPMLVILDFDKSIYSFSFSNLKKSFKVPIIVFIDRQIAEQKKSLFTSRSIYSKNTENTVLVAKSISAEQALSLFSEYLDGDPAPIIKWN